VNTWQASRCRAPWFTQLPKTSTGKIQKFMLRDMAKKL
jgi:acyl-coenzyme A synthetase/AMP-(fatty) acid ligase